MCAADDRDWRGSAKALLRSALRDQLKLVWVALLLLILSETLHHVIGEVLSQDSSPISLLSELTSWYQLVR